MSNNDQHLVDHLFEQIFTQQSRMIHFDSISQRMSNNSVWNKSGDEKAILDMMVKKYKQYFINKVEKMKTKLNEIKENNVNSYLTYDPEYYINEYNERMGEINKYLTELDARTLDHLAKDKLSFVSEKIELLFPGFICDPTLLGKL